MSKFTIFLSVFLLAQMRVQMINGLFGGFKSTISNSYNNIVTKTKDLGSEMNDGYEKVASQITNNTGFEGMVTKVDSALTTTEDQIGTAKKTMWDGIDSLNQTITDMNNKLRNFIDSRADEMTNAASKGANNNVATLCLTIMEKFRSQTRQELDNVTSCVMQPFDSTVTHVRSVSELGDNIRNTIQSSRKKVLSCSFSDESTIEKLKCIREPSQEALLTIPKSIPQLISESAGALKVIAEARPKMEVCMTSSTYENIDGLYKKMLGQFQKCQDNVTSQSGDSSDVNASLSTTKSVLDIDSGVSLNF